MAATKKGAWIRALIVLISIVVISVAVLIAVSSVGVGPATTEYVYKDAKMVLARAFSFFIIT